MEPLPIHNFSPATYSDVQLPKGGNTEFMTPI